MTENNKHRLAWERFKEQVADYKAMGVRMVVIEWPHDQSVLFAFNTHGVNAETIDPKRFLSPPVRRWAEGASDFGPDDVVRVLDVTDDFGAMSAYDTCEFVVQQLVKDEPNAKGIEIHKNGIKSAEISTPAISVDAKGGKVVAYAGDNTEDYSEIFVEFHADDGKILQLAVIGQTHDGQGKTRMRALVCDGVDDGVRWNHKIEVGPNSRWYEMG